MSAADPEVVAFLADPAYTPGTGDRPFTDGTYNGAPLTAAQLALVESATWVEMTAARNLRALDVDLEAEARP